MNKKELFELAHQVQQNLFWIKFIGDEKTKKSLEKTNKFKFASNEELEKMVGKLNSFDINLLFDKQFMGVKIHESICGISSELHKLLSKLRNIPFEKFIEHK